MEFGDPIYKIKEMAIERGLVSNGANWMSIECTDQPIPRPRGAGGYLSGVMVCKADVQFCRQLYVVGTIRWMRRGGWAVEMRLASKDFLESWVGAVDVACVLKGVFGLVGPH